MQNTVLVVGEKFRYSEEFLEYLKRKIYAKITKIDAFLFIKENDPNILGELESFIDKSSNIIIATPKTSFALIGKTLSTHAQDTLVQKGDMLVPSKHIDYTDGSYLVKVQDKLVNVIRLDTTCEIPTIMIEETIKIKKAFILDSDEESAKLLIAPIAATSEINVTIFKNPSGYIEVIAEEKRYGNLDSFMQKLQKLFGDKIVIADSLEEFLIASLRAKKSTIAFAESCTGGLLSHMFVKISGASDVFVGSLVTYSNDAKIAWLRVSEEEIEENGAVSEQTVSQMLDGTLKISLADFAVAISGIAGPSGAVYGKPVGLVYIGVKHKSGVLRVEKNIFFGDRELIQSSSAGCALKIICEILKEISKSS